MSQKERYIILLLLILLVIPLGALLPAGLPLTHDGKDHVARIANFYINLSQGNIIPRWAPNLNWGYGHPILMFLYPFPSYFASLFHFFGFSIVDSIKIVFGISYILSGLFMYFWLRKIIGEYPAILSALFYCLAPYRFVDMYVRGAIGEHVAFIFLPAVMYFVYSTSQKINKKNIIGLSLTFSSLLLSHNAVSMMFLPIIFFYILFILKYQKNSKNFLLTISVAFLIGLLLSSFFLLPAFLEGKYTLRDIVTRNEYQSRFETLSRLIYSEWSFGGSGLLSVQVGIMHWIYIIISPFFIYKLFLKNKKYFYVVVFCFISFWTSLFMMTNYSRLIWENISIIQKFQFPWRFLSISIFLASVLSGFVLYAIPSYKKIIFTSSIFLLFFFNRGYWNANGYLNLLDKDYKSVYDGTTDTGESAPIWSVRFMERRPRANYEIISGSGHISELYRDAITRKYKINLDEDSRIRENTLYFPGWTVDSGSKEILVEFQDPSNRGLITYNLPKGEHLVTIKFNETKLRTASNILSGAAVFIIILIIVLPINNNFKNKYK